jgi:hypothetical protein
MNLAFISFAPGMQEDKSVMVEDGCASKYYKWPHRPHLLICDSYLTHPNLGNYSKRHSKHARYRYHT